MLSLHAKKLNLELNHQPFVLLMLIIIIIIIIIIYLPTSSTDSSKHRVTIVARQQDRELH